MLSSSKILRLQQVSCWENFGSTNFGSTNFGSTNFGTLHLLLDQYSTNKDAYLWLKAIFRDFWSTQAPFFFDTHR